MPTPVAWSPTLNFNFRQADSQTQLRCVQLANGDLWVVWTDHKDFGVGSPAGTDLVGQRYDALGAAIGGEVRLNSNFFVDNERNAQLAADVGGNEFFIVYEDLNGDGSTDIVLERKNGDGSAIGFLSIASDPDNSASGIGFRNPQVAVASATSGIVVFERTDSAGLTDVVGQLFDPSTGALVGGLIVIRPGTFGNAQNPDLAVTSDGRYSVVWEENGDILGNWVTQNGTRAGLFNISTSNGLEADPSVIGLGGGRIAVSWTLGTGQFSSGIYGAVHDSSGVAIGAFIVDLNGVDGDSHLARTSDTSFVLAWENTSNDAITLRSFTVDAFGGVAPSGTAATVANTESQSDLALLGLADGRVLIGYDSPLGSARIFDPRAAPNAAPVYAPTDQQIGTPGADVFTAAANADIVHGWDGDDIITDGPGTEAHYFGGNGNDIIRFTFVDSGETADGGPGEDTLVYLSLAGATSIDLAAGTARTGAVTQSVVNFENYATSSGIAQTITVSGTALANQLTTSSGNDILHGLGGDDRLDGGPGADTMIGGLGDDLYFVDNASDSVTEAADEGVDEVRTTLASYTLPGNVENLTGLSGAGNQALTGNALNNRVTGSDTSNDSLDGGLGADVLTGGGGNDFYIVDNAGDSIVEAAGGGVDYVASRISYSLAAGVQAETLSALEQGALAALNLTGNEFGQDLIGNAGANTLDGGGGVDRMIGLAGNDFYIVDNAGDSIVEFADDGNDYVAARVSYALTAGAQVETLSALEQGGLTAINLTGNAFGQDVIGNAGANVLTGGGGADRLIGLAGDDFYIVDSADDSIIEYGGDGRDYVAASVSYTLAAGAEVETLSALEQGGTAALNLTGNGFAQDLIGNNGGNLLNGGGGADRLIGLGGDDFYVIDSADDSIVEFAGGGVDYVYARASWTLSAGAEVETVSTESHAATDAVDLNGNELANTMIGNNGANILNGREGADRLVGLGGADAFVFNTALAGGNIDQILDMTVGVDKIILDDAVFAGLALGNLAAGAFNTGSTASDADDRILYDASTGALYFDADGAGGAAAVQFATLSTGLAMSASEFTVI